MPANIAFYSDALTSGRYGLGRYAGELLRALQRHAGQVSVRPVSAHVSLGAEELQSLKQDHGYKRLPLPRKIIAGLWSKVNWPRLEQFAPWADVVHCVELDYRVATRKPVIVTIHDLGPLTHPQFFHASHPWLLARALQWAADEAAAIICVSRTTAMEVEEHLGFRLGERLTVVPEGVGGEFSAPVGDECLAKTGEFVRQGTPFFLWSGSVNPRKNLPRVIAAFERVAADVPHHLVLTGGLGWDAEETLRRVLASRFGDRIHLPGRVSDAELRGLYQRADGFVFASLMEGFGLPILEAMACGCPVITSDISSMPEVAGDAALMVDPTDADEIAGALRRVATDPALRQTLATKGRARAAQFRWDICAAAVAGIYERVSQSGSASRLPLAA